MQRFFEIIENHLRWGWENGVQLPVLGSGDNALKRFYTATLILVGDDPALNRTVGIFEGMPLRGCR